MMRVRASGLHEISEVSGKGSRVNVIDSNAMARVEVASLINTNGRCWPCTVGTKIRPSNQRVPESLSKVELISEGEYLRCRLRDALVVRNLKVIERHEVSKAENITLRNGIKSCSINAWTTEPRLSDNRGIVFPRHHELNSA